MILGVVNQAVKFNLKVGIRTSMCTPVLKVQEALKSLLATVDVVYKALWDCGKPEMGQNV